MTKKEMAQAIEAYATLNGGVHDEDCPGDDTCACQGKWINDGVNAAVKQLRADDAFERVDTRPHWPKLPEGTPRCLGDTPQGRCVRPAEHSGGCRGSLL